ncbi:MULTISPECIES: cytochrome c family protein [Rhodomicrobium]|uniref:c-type cytochrome n=1 Tax=Rhodomicrobium TaxID=1068 RepID=UPI000B4BA053|nr:MULTISPECIES: cytochrome c family protein [Rhodomicrobium]
MDKMTVNMIAGAVLSALLVVFGANTAIDILYPRGGGPEAPVESHAASAPAAPADAGPAQPLPVLLASGNAEAGAGVAKKCAACHSFEKDGPNKIGPNLYGVVGRPVASHGGFAYSEALKAYGGNWDYEKLNCFLHNPKTCVPGTKMAFAGLQDKDRANAIAYLRSVSPDAPPLPAASAAPATKEASAAHK